MNDNAYLRHPTLHGDTVVFVSDDDLWRVGTGGGVALRLTAGLSEPSTPCLSPDGRWALALQQQRPQRQQRQRPLAEDPPLSVRARHARPG